MLHILEFIARRVGMMKKCVQQSGWRVNSILISLPSCHSRISNAVICYIAASIRLHARMAFQVANRDY